MTELKTDYLDDVLDTSQNQLRKYSMIQNDDGTVSFVDVTKYSQNGDNFGAKDVNDIVARIGEVSKAENIAYNDEKSVQGAIDELKGTIGYTSKNLIPYPHYSTTFSQNGIDWTDLGDGRVKANGISTGQTTYYVRYRTGNPLPINLGKYILSGCPQNGEEKGYRLFIGNTVDSSLNVIATDYGESATFTTEDTEIGIFCQIDAGVTVDNLVFEPMIRYASIEDDTYEPYVADVQTQLTTVQTINLRTGATLYVYGKIAILILDGVVINAENSLLISDEKYKPIQGLVRSWCRYDSNSGLKYHAQFGIYNTGHVTCTSIATDGSSTSVNNGKVYGQIMFNIK